MWRSGRALILLLLAFCPPVLGQEVGGNEATVGEEEPAPVVEPPVLLQFVHAEYPAEAEAQGLEAAVQLLVVVDAEGKVTEIAVQESAGEAFDNAAMTAVSKFEFTPATMDGEPIPVRIGYTYRFKLEEKSVKVEPGQMLTGTIKEKGVGLPVVGAEVTLEGRARTTTDAKGKFTLRRIKPGTYNVFVSASEYKPLETELTLEEGKTLNVSLLLESAMENPYEIVVKGEKQKVVVTKYVLEQRTLETVPGTFGDPVRVVETLPGVARSSYGAGLLIVRGTKPNDTKVFVDGIEVPLIYHFLAGPSIINPNFLQDIGYYPGNYPTKYGEAIGGIVDVTTTKERPDVFGGEVDINLLNAGAYADGPIGEDGSFRLGVRRSYIDAVLALALAMADADSFLIAPIYWDFQAQAMWNANEKNRLGVFWLGSHDALSLVTSSDDEDDSGLDLTIKTDFNRVIATWRHAQENFSLVVKPYFGYDAFNFDTGPLSLEAEGFLVGTRTDAEYSPTKWFSWNFGGDGAWYTTTYSGELPTPKDYYHPGSTITGLSLSDEQDVEHLEFADDYWRGSTYFDLVFQPAEGLLLTPGFRIETWNHPGGSVLLWDPRFVARWQIGGGVSVKGGVGRFSQPPQPGNLDETYGNPDLGPEWAMHYSAGLEWQPYDKLIIDVQGYYTRTYDLVTQAGALEADDDGSVSTASFLNTGYGRSYGMELLIKHAPTDYFYGWIAYTLARSELAGFDFIKGDAGAAGNTGDLVLSPFDQTHILSVVGSVKLGRGWETGLRLRLVSGNPFTPTVGGRFSGDTNGFSPITGAIRSKRLPAFFQLDARVEKKWTFDSWLLTLYLDVQNVTNHANSEFFTWDYRFRESWKVPGIPFFPSLGINGRF
jgi:TonB family protein